ncbi:MAG: hypothetical protein NVSMB12_12580 [Acidimicrobiales bacterium]
MTDHPVIGKVMVGPGAGTWRASRWRGRGCAASEETTTALDDVRAGLAEDRPGAAAGALADGRLGAAAGALAEDRPGAAAGALADCRPVLVGAILLRAAGDFDASLMRSSLVRMPAPGAGTILTGRRR